MRTTIYLLSIVLLFASCAGRQQGKAEPQRFVNAHPDSPTAKLAKIVLEDKTVAICSCYYLMKRLMARTHQYYDGR